MTVLVQLDWSRQSTLYQSSFVDRCYYALRFYNIYSIPSPRQWFKEPLLLLGAIIGSIAMSLRSLKPMQFVRMQHDHDDVIKWKHFPRNWPFVRGIHRSPVNSPHKGQWRGALMFSLICAWLNDWVNKTEAGDLRRYRTHYDVIVMTPDD